MRIETGALQIDDDWTGLFVRGDDAYYLGMLLNKFLINGLLYDEFEKVIVEKYIRIIDCDVDHKSWNREVQRIKTV